MEIRHPPSPPCGAAGAAAPQSQRCHSGHAWPQMAEETEAGWRGAGLLPPPRAEAIFSSAEQRRMSPGAGLVPASRDLLRRSERTSDDQEATLAAISA